MDKSGLIPIGRFAKLTDLSPRLLRRLDERGLLSPVFVDPDTRYRYYDLGQTRVASLVHLGRQLGLTMDQMADLIAASERGDLRRHLQRHRDGVAARLAGLSRLLRLLDQELEREEPLMTYEIALKEVPAVLVMSAPGSVPRTHPHDPWSLERALRRTGAKALVQIARQGVEPAAPAIILYHTDFEVDDEIAFEVCIPVPRRLSGGPGVECKELPGRARRLRDLPRPLRHDLERPRRAARVDRRERLRRRRPGPRARGGHRRGHGRPPGVGHRDRGAAGDLTFPPGRLASSRALQVIQGGTTMRSRI